MWWAVLVAIIAALVLGAVALGFAVSDDLEILSSSSLSSLSSLQRYLDADTWERASPVLMFGPLLSNDFYDFTKKIVLYANGKPTLKHNKIAFPMRTAANAQRNVSGDMTTEDMTTGTWRLKFTSDKQEVWTSPNSSYDVVLYNNRAVFVWHSPKKDPYAVLTMNVPNVERTPEPASTVFNKLISMEIIPPGFRYPHYVVWGPATGR